MKQQDIFSRIFYDKKLFAGIITLALFLYIAYASIPFLSAMFGAIFLAYIFYPLYKKINKKFSRGLSATFVLIIAGLLIIIPVTLIINSLINQIYYFIEELDTIKNVSEQLHIPLSVAKVFQNEAIINDVILSLSGFITPFISNVVEYFVLIFLLFFLLFYFLIYFEDIVLHIKKSLPFSERSNNEIILQFKQVTDATIIGTFFIAAVQGGLLALNFYLLDISNALLWGFITGIFSFIPFLGAPIIWLPAAFFLLSKQEIGKAVTLVIVGVMISTIDNIIRPLINQRYGSIHPVKSIIGIFIGIYQFGIIGIFIGPLIVVYLFLFWKIYREEL